MIVWFQKTLLYLQPWRVIGISQGMVRGGGGAVKNPFVGEAQIFSGTMHFSHQDIALSTICVSYNSYYI